MTGPDTLGKRLGRWATLLGVVFVIMLAVVVAQRLSDDTVALLLGLGCGIAVMTPTLGFGFLLLRREWTRAATPAATPPTGTPQIIVVAPPALPGYGAPVTYPQVPNNAWSQPANTGRTFTIVGGEE
ncbi:MAG TPA: hypothetical protein PKH77_13610 [Anaerolineae bacterium]|nr:hypothetical protein [Anaerolineae bacterium]